MLANVGGTAPTTPRAQAPRRSPPQAPRRKPPPPLMAALDMSDDAQCAVRVAEVLKMDSEAALFPFFDHDCEPPLCYAVRQGCGIEAIRLLIERGADVNAADMWGQTPLMLLSACLRDAMRDMDLAKLLLDAGAYDAMDTANVEAIDQSASDANWVHPSRWACRAFEPPPSPQIDFDLFQNDGAQFLDNANLGVEHFEGSSISLPVASPSRTFAWLGA